jgi:aryl carrier-like protein
LAALTAPRVEAVLRPKLAGALALHRLAPPGCLFVMFGSVAGLWGNAGQVAYSAANAGLSAFAAWRRAQGLPTLCLDWGPWSERGMAARAGALRRAEALGLGALGPADGAALFGRLLSADAASLGVVAVDWRQFGGVDPFFARLSTPATVAQRPADAVLAAVAAAFQMAPDTLSVDESLIHLGLDSVIALDLKSRLQRAAGLDVPVAELLLGPTTRALMDRAAPAADIDTLSDDEVEALLNQLLQQQIP